DVDRLPPRGPRPARVQLRRRVETREIEIDDRDAARAALRERPGEARADDATPDDQDLRAIVRHLLDDAVPEPVPARPLLGQRAAALLALRPVGWLLRERSLGRLDAVPEPVHAAHEQPDAVAALVAVAVVDRLLDPALSVLDLRAAVDAA